jgi:hypothetical protein
MTLSQTPATASPTSAPCLATQRWLAPKNHEIVVSASRNVPETLVT